MDEAVRSRTRTDWSTRILVNSLTANLFKVTLGTII